MPRISTRSIPACPTLFTPLQLHVREALRLGVWSWVGWHRDHILSLQTMIREHGFAVVVAGASVEYLRDHLFPEADAIDISTTASVHRRGALIEGVSTFAAGGRDFARMRLYLRPVQIGDENSAAARPADLPEEVRARFAPEEVAPGAYPRPAKTLSKSLEESGELLAQWEQPFKLYRYAMDFADQWAFMETAAYVSASREELALARGGECPALLDALSQPVRDYCVELSKPYFLMDTGRVVTRAYQWQGALHFEHRLMGVDAGAADVHATVVERMAGGASVAA